MDFIIKMDHTILQFIQNTMKNSLFDQIMPILTLLGDGGVIWLLISAILLISPQYRKVGLLAIATLILGAILGEIIIKPLIGRPRPFSELLEFVLLIEKPTTFSFPSGHTASSFGVATIIALNIRKYRVPAYLMAFSISFSRLYLYVHYPSDIVAGCLLGMISALLVQHILNKKNKTM